MNETPQHPLADEAVDYVLGHQEAADRVAFVQAMEKDDSLRQLVADLSESAAALVFSLPQTAAPAAAREHVLQRVLAIPQDRAPLHSTASTLAPQPKLNLLSFVGWGLAACFLVYVLASNRSHNMELQKTQDQLAANEQRAQSTLASLKQEIETQRAASEAASSALASALQSVESAKTQLKAMADESRDMLAKKEADYAKVVAERDQVAAERDKLVASQQMATMQIATLQATIDDYKQGVAVVVWNAEKQQGVLKLEKMPRIPANKDFQLWVLDPAQKSPVSSGTVRVDENGFAKVDFKPSMGITQADKFAISVEKKGGVAAPEGPIVLLSN